MRALAAIAACSLVVAAVACGSGGSPASPSVGSPGGGSQNNGVTGGGPTFHKDVEPIVQQHCQMCHVDGGIAPMALVTYAEAKSYANLMAQKTKAGLMPPWGAVESPDCEPPYGWKNDPRLTAEQIATISAWAAAGAPEGDPADAPKGGPPKPVGLDNVSAELSAPAAYPITDTGADQFRCFVLDPKVTATTWISGHNIVPGNKTVVHHALVFTDSKRESLAKVTDHATQSYDCFGGPGVSNPSLLAAWAPGTQPTEYPSNVGAKLDANTLLVMQIHYHPHTAQASLTPDQTKFQMRFATTKPQYEALTLLPGNFDSKVQNGTGLLDGPNDPPTGPVFLIPADAKGHTETMQVTLPTTVQGGLPFPNLQILGVGGHEHYVGVSERVTIHHANPTPGTPQDQCLVNIPNWDFNWQRGYSYDAPVGKLPYVGGGDVLQIKCTYDNTMGNPKVAQALTEQGLSQPRDVRLGETTLDEMCLAPIVLLAPNL